MKEIPLTQGKRVSWDSVKKAWKAYISPGNQFSHLGLFQFEEDAAKAYDAAALKHFGEFAHLNFPLTGKQ